MPDRLTLPLAEPPDLLRRLVPTPHEACIQTGELCVHIKTNDARLLRVAGGGDGGCDVGSVEWTMVCDAEMPPELSEPLLLDSETTSFLSFGLACYVAMDHAKREITGFVSAEISDEGWNGVVLPAVFEIIAERRR